MRGNDDRTGSLFSYVDLEVRVRQNHPLRTIRHMVNEALLALADDFRRFTRRSGNRRSRRRSCCGRCFCRRSIRSVRNGF